MLGWIFDTSALTTCRLYGSVFGGLPGLCQTSGGRPLLGVMLCCAMLLVVLVLGVRAFRA